MTLIVKCGICGQDMRIEPDVSEDYGIVLLATCPGCRKEIKDMQLEIGDLEDDNFDLSVALGKHVQKEGSHED